MDVVALGELLIDFTENGTSAQDNKLFEANPGGAPCNVLAMLQKLGHQTAFIGKVGQDAFGRLLVDAVKEQGIDTLIGLIAANEKAQRFYRSLPNAQIRDEGIRIDTNF